MQEIRLPVVKDQQTYFPTQPMCPWCGQEPVHEPHPMAILSAGALESLGNDCYGMTDGAVAFFNLAWHAQHVGDKVNDNQQNSLISVEIADNVATGQFDLYFCSTTCLRAFLNHCVD